MLKEDKILWQVLAIIGLNFFRHRFGNFEKYFRILFFLYVSFSFIYVAILNLRMIIKNKHYKIGISYVLFPIYSALMWYFAYSRRKYISNALFQTYYYRKRYHALKKRSSCIILLMVIIILSSPCLACISTQIMVNFETENMAFWIFDFKIHNIIWKRILLFNANFSYYLICICFPFYLTFALSLLFYRCSEALSNYDTAVKNGLRTKANNNIEILEEFFDIVKFVQNINEALSILSFLIVSHSLQGIFTVLLTPTLDKTYTNNFIYLIPVTYYFTCSIVMIIMYTICSSMIPNNFLRIRKTATEFINRHGYGHVAMKQNIFCLKRIEREEIMYISVCELFHLTKSFILSALGTILTYGLLVANLQF